MRWLMTICLVSLVVCGLTSVAAAQPIDGGQTTVKWYQGPDLETGNDWGSMTGWVITADDFLCTSPMPVTDVHWWGSYWAGQDPQPINGFNINFYSDVPASPTNGEASHPGDLLYQAYIQGNCNETYYGYSAGDYTNVYQYGTILPEAFVQIPDTVYWLSIVVDQGWESYPSWGWHSSYTHWNDIAVQTYVDNVSWFSPLEQDMAFYLTVPEPATMSLLGLGALSLIRRKKHA